MPTPVSAPVAPGLLLDSRLALFHQTDRWLAIADLHFGYELTQRAAGSLIPLWGMQTIEHRLLELLEHYRPDRLVIVGDVVHDATSVSEAQALLERIGADWCPLVAIAGNHDRKIARRLQLQEAWETDGFVFHHGHCERDSGGRIQIIGHHHPAATLRDGAGLHLKLPAFIQQGSCWILPAFSPWAAGSTWQRDEESRVWVCAPGRILQLPAGAAD